MSRRVNIVHVTTGMKLITSRPGEGGPVFLIVPTAVDFRPPMAVWIMTEDPASGTVTLKHGSGFPLDIAPGGIANLGSFTGNGTPFQATAMPDGTVTFTIYQTQYCMVPKGFENTADVTTDTVNYSPQSTWSIQDA